MKQITNNKEIVFGKSTAKRLLVEMYNHRFRKNYTTRLAKEIKCTQSGCAININLLEKMGLITKNKAETMKILILTDKGETIARLLSEIEENLK